MLGFTPPPARPLPVPRDYDFDPADQQEKKTPNDTYVHSDTHRVTFVQGLYRLPFDIFECTPLLDLIKSTVTSNAAKLPTKTELQAELNQLKQS
jgi:hypothetical protein